MNPDDQNNPTVNNPVIDITPPPANDPAPVSTPESTPPDPLQPPVSADVTPQVENILPPIVADTEELLPADIPSDPNATVMTPPVDDLMTTQPSVATENITPDPLQPPVSADVLPQTDTTLPPIAETPTADTSSLPPLMPSDETERATDSLSGTENGPFSLNFTPESSAPENLPPAPPAVEVLPPTPLQPETVIKNISPDVSTPDLSQTPPPTGPSDISTTSPVENHKGSPLKIFIYIILSIVIGVGIGLAVQYFFSPALPPIENTLPASVQVTDTITTSPSGYQPTLPVDSVDESNLNESETNEPFGTSAGDLMMSE